MATPQPRFTIECDLLSGDVETDHFEAVEGIFDLYSVIVGFTAQSESFRVEGCLRHRMSLCAVDASGNTRFYNGIVDQASLVILSINDNVLGSSARSASSRGRRQRDQARRRAHRAQGRGAGERGRGGLEDDVDKLKGSLATMSAGPATFIGALHKMEATGKITFKCGASEVVIDAGGISIKAPIVAILAPKIQLPNKVSEVR